MERISIEDLDLDRIEGKKTFRLEVSPLFDCSPISIPCGVISNGEGPKVCILSGQHGNEWNGIYSSQHFFKDLDESSIKGTTIILPVVNPLAFNEKSRVSTIDHIDLNRTFSNQARSKPTKYLGEALFKNILSKMDHVIDLHTGGPGEYSPHVTVASGENEKLASKLLFSKILRDDLIEGGFSEGSLEYTSREEDFTSLTIEAGFQRDIDQGHVDKILDGLENFFRYLDMMAGKSKSIDYETYREKKMVTSPTSGFFEPTIELDDFVESGDTIGKVENILEGEQQVESTTSGKVLYLRKERVVAKGENLLHLVRG